MGFVWHILRLLFVILVSALGASMAFAAPMNISEISFYQAENTLFAQASDVGFAARAPPLAMSNDLVSSGSSAGDAAWGTPLGKTMKQLGFTKVEVGSGNNPSFKFGF